MKLIETALASVPDELWNEIRELSQPISAGLSKFGWINNKYYKRSLDNESGCVEQVDYNGEREIPYKRDFFRVRSARFAIPDRPVSYFSNDFAINCCETMDEFRREENLSWSGLARYFNGETDPTPGWKGYPMKVKISDKALILDLTNQSLPFINYLATAGVWESRQKFLDSLILSRDAEVYRETQLISLEAFKRGFKGICYQSVRGPKDVRLGDRNLVVFDRSTISVKQYC